MDRSAYLLFIAGSVLPSFAIALLSTYVVRRFARQWGLIDLPSERKVHTAPTPRGGGLAIWLGVVGTFAVAQLFLLIADRVPAVKEFVPPFAREHLPGIWAQSGKLWVLLAAGTGLMVLGLADDRGGLPWQFRLLVEFVVAGLCVWLVPNLRLTAFIPYPLITESLSVLWIVALINSFNMLDNMDGLSSGVA